MRSSAAVVLLASSLVTAVDLTTFDCAGPSSEVYHAFRFHVPRLPSEFLQRPFDEAERRGFWLSNTDTSHFEFERYFVRLLALHPCHTTDAAQASAFYVPAQVCSAHVLGDDLKGPKYDPEHASFYRRFEGEVIAFLRKRYRKQTDSDLLLTHYVSTWPFHMKRVWKASMSLVGPEVAREMGQWQGLLNYEGRFDLDTVRFGFRDIVIPYPDREAQALTPAFLDTVVRDKLVIFHGSADRFKPTRLLLRDQFARHPDKALWEETAQRDARAPNDTWAMSTARGVFGIMAPGDSLTSRRVFSLVLAETIPVIFDDLLVGITDATNRLPYAAFLDWSQLAIFVPERRLSHDRSFDLVDFLEAIPQAEVERRRRNLRAVRQHFTFYDDEIQPGDAIDLFVREMAMAGLKIRSNLDVVKRNVEFGKWTRVRPPVREDEQPMWCWGILGKLCWRWSGL